MLSDSKYQNDIILQKEALQGLLTNIKNYPVVDVDYIAEDEVDDKDRAIWENYTDGTPCIKITYGDNNTTKGNIIFANDLRAEIRQLTKQLNNKTDLRDANEKALAFWTEVYEKNLNVFNNRIETLNYYTNNNITQASLSDKAAVDAIGKLLEEHATSAIYTSEYNQNSPKWVKKELTITAASNAEEQGEWTSCTVEATILPPTDNTQVDSRNYYSAYLDSIANSVITTEAQRVVLQQLKTAIESYPFWEQLELNASNISDDKIRNIQYYVIEFLRGVVQSAEQKKDAAAAGLAIAKEELKNTNLAIDELIKKINKYNSYIDKVATGSYRLIKVDNEYKLDFNYRQIEPNEQYNSEIEYFERVKDFVPVEYDSEADWIADRDAGKVYVLINNSYGQATSSYTYDSETTYYNYVDTDNYIPYVYQEGNWNGDIASGKVYTVDTTQDRTMYGYKYVKVGSNISFDDGTGNILEPISAEEQSAQDSGTFRVTVNNHIYEVPIKGLTSDEDGNLIGKISNAKYADYDSEEETNPTGIDPNDTTNRVPLLISKKYVKKTGDTMSGSLTITLENYSTDTGEQQEQEGTSSSTTTTAIIRNISELEYNGSNNIKLNLDFEHMPIVVDNEALTPTTSPSITLTSFINPYLNDANEIITKDQTSEPSSNTIQSVNSQNTIISTEHNYTTNVTAAQANSQIMCRGCMVRKTNTTGAREVIIDTSSGYDFGEERVYAYETSTPILSTIIKNVNSLSDYEFDFDLCHITIPTIEYTICGLDTVQQMKHSADDTGLQDIVNTATNLDNIKIKGPSNESTSASNYNASGYKIDPSSKNRSNTEFLFNVMAYLYNNEYLQKSYTAIDTNWNTDMFKNYKVIPYSYVDFRVNAYSYNNNQEYPSLANRKQVYYFNNNQVFTLDYEPVYFVYWGREISTTTNEVNNARYPILDYLQPIEVTTELDNATFINNENAVYDSSVTYIKYRRERYENFGTINKYLERATEQEFNTYKVPTAEVEEDVTFPTGEVRTAYVSYGVCAFNSDTILQRRPDNGINLSENVANPTIEFYDIFNYEKVTLKENAAYEEDQTYYKYNANTRDYEVFAVSSGTWEQEKNNLYYKNLNSKIVDFGNVLLDSETIINSFNVYAYKQYYEYYIDTLKEYNREVHNSTDVYSDLEYDTLLQLQKCGNYLRANFKTAYESFYCITAPSIRANGDYKLVTVNTVFSKTLISIPGSYTGSLPELLEINYNGFTHYFSYYDTTYPQEVNRGIGVLCPYDYFIIKAMRPKMVPVTNVITKIDETNLGNNFNFTISNESLTGNIFGQSFNLNFETFYQDFIASSIIDPPQISKIQLYNTISNPQSDKENYNFKFNSLTVNNNTPYSNTYSDDNYTLSFVPMDDADGDEDNTYNYGIGLIKTNYATRINWDSMTQGSGEESVSTSNNYIIYRGIFNTNTEEEYQSDITYYELHEDTETKKKYYSVWEPPTNETLLEQEWATKKDSLYIKDNTIIDNRSKYIQLFEPQQTNDINSNMIARDTVTTSSVTNTETTQGIEGIEYTEFKTKALEVNNGLSQFNATVRIDMTEYEQGADSIKDTTKPIEGAAALQVIGAGYFSKSLIANRVYNAVFNDYAECRKTIAAKAGSCVIDKDDGSLELTSKRLMPGAQIISDTFGNCMGETEECKTPLAVAGRVLVYPYQARAKYHAGMAVCSAPNGTVDIMTRDEIREYPDAIIGIVSEIPEYDTWGTDNVKVDGRIWIKVR